MQATQVVERLPRLLELHERGEVSAVHVAAAAELTGHLDGIWSTHTAADAEAMYARLTELAKNDRRHPHHGPETCRHAA